MRFYNQSILIEILQRCNVKLPLQHNLKLTCHFRCFPKGNCVVVVRKDVPVRSVDIHRHDIDGLS